MDTHETIKNETISEVEYVGFWKRVLASILDIIILSPVLFFYMKHYIYFMENKLFLPVLLYTILSYCFQVFFQVRYGGTPGKLITKIRIVNDNGQYISVLQSLTRLSPQLVSTILSFIANFFILNGVVNRILLLIVNLFTFFFLIDVLAVVFNKKKRAIHDYIANTYVVTKQSLNEVKEDSIDLI
ncbi:putative RDD family membrane protein YckC [Anaerosolibacter carboniphilus]|uniref:Putative RDD family membrane protein YckC n=1 Tax=Anaerosolibacter carboniphilus TaxID=1417629 RepID=A0A841KY71_9FIRM|nr:RDD family protein [Anaerosolibacter carboniphilus]MBB6218716.1 putative RDD family membrane protein YckC [Anaerosolibacter carboniphilus]